MHKKFEVNRTKIKGGCQLERKAAEMISYSKMPPKTANLLLGILTLKVVYTQNLHQIQRQKKSYPVNELYPRLILEKISVFSRPF